MANQFDQNNILTNKSGKRTSGRILINYFKKLNALSEGNAISVEELKNVSLTNEIVAYTIANFMEGDLIIRTTDGKYYFDEANYKKFERKTILQMVLIFSLPIIILLIISIISGGLFPHIK